MLARGMKLLVVTAERRSTIAGDKSGGIQAYRPITPHLRHRQPDQSLDTGQENVSRTLCVSDRD
jgi:hypothetical protein